jgi:cell division protein FtsW
MAPVFSHKSKKVPTRYAGSVAATSRIFLLLCTLALVLIGLVMVYSSSSIKAIDAGDSASTYVVKQLVWVGIGAVLAFVLWKFIPLRVWRGPALWVAYGIAVAMLTACAIIGTDINGGKRWLPLFGSFGIQPAEFAKVVFILMAARIITDLREGLMSGRALVVQTALILLPLFIFVYRAESDLGSTLICVFAILAVMWFGEVNLRWILLIVGAGIVFIILAIKFSGYRSNRLLFLDPWSDGADGYDKGYQIIRSYYAIADGGLFGVGLGNSHEKYLYLFSSESDFIFSIIAEECGLIGACVVIALFAAFYHFGLRIAQASTSQFGILVAAGFCVAIVFQAFVNIGSAVGALPTTGKPLPFISSGGSSMLATFIMLGLILRVSNETESDAIYQERRRNLRVVHSDNSMARESMAHEARS